MDLSVRPKHLENEFFYKHDLDLIEEQHQNDLRLAAEREEKALHDLHWMKCPACGHDLKEASYDGLKVQRCHDCSGVFLPADMVEKLELKESSQSFLTTLHKLLVGESVS